MKTYPPPTSPTDPTAQDRRRILLGTWVMVLTLVGLLFWFLLHPSTNSSPARKLKELVFGSRFTEAAEQFASHSGEPGQNPGSGQGSSGGAGKGSSPKGNPQDSSNGTGAHSAGEGGDGGGQHSSNEGHGTPLSGPVSGPANPQGPTNNPSELPAPTARSIGWLDRFFGTQPPNDNSPIHPGEGGTSAHEPQGGNTNTTIRAANTNAPVAAEFTESNPPAPSEISLDEPPATPRSTNRAPASAGTLNDNFEQLLRQHRAGSGDVRISLMWTNKNDLDLHVVDPNGEEIFYGHRLARSGGLLDIDMNASPPLRVPAVENIFWPQRAAPAGQYHIYVNHYRRHDSADLTAFTVRVLLRGRTTDINGSIRFGEPKKLVHQFTLPSAG